MKHSIRTETTGKMRYKGSKGVERETITAEGREIFEFWTEIGLKFDLKFAVEHFCLKFTACLITGESVEKKSFFPPA